MRDVAVYWEGDVLTEVTRVLAAVEEGDQQAAAQLLPLVYDELRRLAAQKLRHETPGQTLDATALVHEAYMRLVQSEQKGSSPSWNSRGHFFAAAAEAMRRILVERARHKRRLKRGGGRHRQELGEIGVSAAVPAIDLLALDVALDRLERKDRRKAQLVKLRYFAGLTVEEAAQALGISRSTADADWVYAKSWLRVQIDSASSADES
jgi:RNA polymerase sigma factor (TIGR02999 family)